MSKRYHKKYGHVLDLHTEAGGIQKDVIVAGKWL